MKTNKICFTAHTVAITTTLRFDEMAVLQELLQLGAMEAAESGNAGRVMDITTLADNFGIEVDVDIEPPTPEAEVLGNDSGEEETYLPDGAKS